MSPAIELEALPEVGGVVQLPGSKSISNRALLVAALAHGQTRLHNLLDSDDVRYMRRALQRLGVDLRDTETSDQAGSVRVAGCAGPLVSGNLEAELQLGMAGTAYRPLTAALCLGGGRFELGCNARMRERPIAPLVDALRELGARIEYLEADGYPPVRVTGTGVPGGAVRMPGDLSSQFLTSLLLAAPLFDAPLEVIVEGEQVSKPYLDLTIDLMRRFGANASHADHRRYRVEPTGYQAVSDFHIEGDASNATYFLAAGAISGNGIEVRGLGRDSVQGDLAFTDVLRAMGAAVDVGEHSVRVQPGALRAVDMDLNHIPDAAMTVAVLALFAEGTTHLRNLYNLRIKETDRLSALAAELTKLGAAVVEGRDSLSITPPPSLRAARIATYDDHRMAMCFSLAALGGGGVVIEDPGCVAKTFPDYFNEFARVAARSRPL